MAASASLTDAQKQRVMARLGPVVTAIALVPFFYKGGSGSGNGLLPRR